MNISTLYRSTIPPIAVALLALFTNETASAQGVANAENVMISDVPHGGGRADVDYGVMSLVQVLSHTGTLATYDTVMGDSGIAFAVPVEVREKPLQPSLRDTNVTWPLAEYATVYGKPWVLAPRLSFVAQTVGRDLTVKFASDKDIQAGASLSAYYDAELAPLVNDSIKRNSPVVALDEPSFILAGYQRNPGGGKVCGFLSVSPARAENSAQPHLENILGVVTPGQKREPLDRRAADRQALEYAVALGDDAALKPDGSRTYLTGGKAYAQWQNLLQKDPEGAAKTGALDGLRSRRQSAVAYLQDMAKRQNPAAARHIKAVIGRYQAMIPLATLDLPKHHDDPIPPQLQHELAARVPRLAKLDRQAANDLKKAIAAMAQ